MSWKWIYGYNVSWGSSHYPRRRYPHRFSERHRTTRKNASWYLVTVCGVLGVCLCLVRHSYKARSGIVFYREVIQRSSDSPWTCFTFQAQNHIIPLAAARLTMWLSEWCSECCVKGTQHWNQGHYCDTQWRDSMTRWGQMGWYHHFSCSGRFPLFLWIMLTTQYNKNV